MHHAFAVCPAVDLVGKLVNQIGKWLLDSCKLPFQNALCSPVLPRVFGAADRTAKHERLVPRREGTVVPVVEFVLCGGLRGKRGRGEECGSGKGFSDHSRLVTRLALRAKQKGRRIAPPALRCSCGSRAYASSISSSPMTGPLSWPLASTSRSTSSITAICAASLPR